ncbi:hypothetical protein JW921_09615 [Candidatus Fermentibacterales bacterium]|nr:hypothetical protein [Candidatus Fermentibacterales bacterium]
MSRIIVLWTAMALLLVAACGGRQETRVDSHRPEGELTANSRSYGFSGATAGVVNARNPLTWNGIAMPGVMQLDLFGEDVEFNAQGQMLTSGRPILTMTIPCGPDGDFYAGRMIVPASFSLLVDNMDIYPPYPYAPFGRVTLLDNPMETEHVGFEVRIAFDKGGGCYEVDVSGSVWMPGCQMPDGRTAGYPALEMPDGLEIHLPDTVLTPRFFVVVEEELELLHQLVVYMFMEPCTVADPRKAEQTYFSFAIPADLVDGQPVPVSVSAYVRQGRQDTTYTCPHPLSWASLEYATDDSTGLEILRGRLLFQNNGSQSATGFYGGGEFALSVKDIIRPW